MQIIRSTTPVALVLALCAALLSLTSTTASARADEEMTQREAGREYLSAICAANDAQADFNDGAFGKRKTMPFAEARRRLPELKRLSAMLSRAFSRKARELFNPPAQWPGDVRSQVDSVARIDIQTAFLLRESSRAANAAGWSRYLVRAVKTANKTTRISGLVRAKLDLPPPGKGC